MECKAKCDDGRPCHRCISRGITCPTDDVYPQEIKSFELGDYTNRKSRNLSEPQYSARPRTLSHSMLEPQLRLMPNVSFLSSQEQNVEEMGSTISTSTFDIAAGVQDDLSLGLKLCADSMWDIDSIHFNPDLRPANTKQRGLENLTWTQAATNVPQNHDPIDQFLRDASWEYCSHDFMQSDNGQGDILGIENQLQMPKPGTDFPTLPWTVPVMAQTQRGFTVNYTQSRLETTPEDLHKEDKPERWSAYGAFQRSLWIWNPGVQTTGFGKSTLSLAGEEVIMAKSIFINKISHEASYGCSITLQPRARDELISLALRFSPSGTKAYSFPSLSLLDLLLQAYFTREESSRYCFIHQGSFKPDNCVIELLAAIIGSGSLFITEPRIFEMGQTLQEKASLSVLDALNESHLSARNVQFMQVFILCIEMGLWSGISTKMEHAEAYSSAIVTVSL